MHSSVEIYWQFNVGVVLTKQGVMHGENIFAKMGAQIDPLRGVDP